MIFIGSRNFSIPLLCLNSFKQAGGFLRSDRIESHIVSKTLPAHLQEFTSLGPGASTLTMKFRSGGRDNFLGQLESAVKAESWIKSPAIVEQRQIKVEGYGIGGIKKALKDDTQDRDLTLSSGFKDLKSLVSMSQELKGLALKLKQMDESQDPELAEIKATMANMGFTSGVTKEIAGKNYIQQLSREICDFIKEPIQCNGGILPVLDAYCIYNRARGGDLISPSEMSQACEMFENLQLPLRVKVLASGTKALQLGGHAVEELMQEIIKKINESGHLSAKEASDLFSINRNIALECLLMAENAGMLCRDQGLQGLHFYSNLFLSS